MPFYIHRKHKSKITITHAKCECDNIRGKRSTCLANVAPPPPSSSGRRSFVWVTEQFWVIFTVNSKNNIHNTMYTYIHTYTSKSVDG